MKLKTITFIALLVFVFLFVSLVLFGKFGLATDPQSSMTFKVGYFMLLLFILSTAYIINFDSLQGILEHTMAIAGLLIVAVLLTMTMQNLKDGYVYRATISPAQQQLKSEVSLLEQKVQDTSATQNELAQQIASINSQNQLLQSNMNTLSAQKAALQKEILLQEKQKQLDAQQQAYQDAIAAQQQAYQDAIAAQQQAYQDAIAAQQANAAAAPNPTPRREDDD